MTPHRERASIVNFHVKKALDKTTNSAQHKREGYLVQMFGCASCLFINTSICPHAIKFGQHHANHICSFRTGYLKEMLEECGRATRIVQTEELFKLRLMSDKLTNDFAEIGDIPDEFKNISKLIISLSDKMRRQDEGIKIQGDVSVEVKNFKDIVDAQAKIIEGTDIIKEAEKIDSQQIDRSGPDLSEKEV